MDSLKKLVPNGIYYLTESGAKKSIKASIDAVAYFQKWQLTDQALGDMANKVSLVSVERNQAITLNSKQAETIKLLTKELRNANIWKYTGLTLAAILTAKLLLR